ncbi:MAG: hypothetical protein KatS3mg087_1204 [Patescibacteria group bacterium]|nr:MAG: hypothetical protein KatS3mg087_1204 [Patescibacteria group bacterium]
MSSSNLFEFVKTVTKNVFCPTGEGGGIDPTCTLDDLSTYGTSVAGSPVAKAKYNKETKQWTLENGDPLPPHLANVRIRPDLKDVVVYTDPNSHILAKGRDKKGRLQMVYSNTFVAQRAIQKYKRIKTLIEEKEEVEAQFAKDAADSDEAAAMLVISKMGLRPGGRQEQTKAEKLGFGVIELQGRHVVREAGKVFLRFPPGKKGGEEVTIEVPDKKLASMLERRAKKAGDNGRLFNTRIEKVRNYLASVRPNTLIKDFRTAVGTKLAMEMMASYDGPPRTKKEYQARLRDIGDFVASKLGNTRAIALKAYIDPTLFVDWQSQLPAPKPKQPKQSKKSSTKKVKNELMDFIMLLNKKPDDYFDLLLEGPGAELDWFEGPYLLADEDIFEDDDDGPTPDYVIELLGFDPDEL